MIYKLPSDNPGYIQVIFELPSCIWADKICLTGDFNQWDESSLPMRQTRSGVWRVSLELPAGQRYEFRYLIDGHWQTDYHADGNAINRYGTDNSIVITELPPAVVASHHGTGAVPNSERRLPWLARPKTLQMAENAA
jgi:hypothetical protein